MGLLSFLQRASGESGAIAHDPGSAAEVRQRARRRLLGAAVLVAAGVIGFPMLFDSAPRPVAVDVPIEIPGKDQAGPMTTAKPSVASGTVAAPVKPAPVEIGTAAEDSRTAASAPASRTDPKAASTPPQAPAEKPPESAQKPPEKLSDQAQKVALEAARAQAALDAKPASSSPATTAAKATGAEARFVIQVGAFSDAGLAREARARVEKLGLVAYTQVVETAAGPRTRVRVGPFGNRGEADRVAQQIKQSGLPAAVLSL